MEKRSPLVSVIVPNYNHQKYLELRLESIFNQTYPHFEVILLDDCSTDQSQEILLEYAKNPKVSHCVFNATNSGNTFVQWNKGIELAKGDYIWIAESDDFCELHFLEELLQPFLQDPEISLVYCQSNRADERGNITGNWLNYTDTLDSELFLTNFVMDGNEFIERFLIHKNVIPNASGVLFQSPRAAEWVGVDIDPVLKTCGDWLQYVKLLSNKKIAYSHKALNCFRYHSASVIASSIKKECLISIIDIELKARCKMITFLLIIKPYNFEGIQKTNRKLVKNLKYEKALFYIRNNEKIKGGLILSTVLDVFYSKHYIFQSFRFKK